MLDKAQLHRLERTLNPKSVAVIGATAEEDRVGYSILESILIGGYKGKILPIHPRHESILGVKVFANLEETGISPDLAIIALNEKSAIHALDECGKHNVKGAICVAGGYKEIGTRGKVLEDELAEAAKRNNIMLIGPNTLGVINAQVKLNATFWPIQINQAGVTSIISQSGGVGQMIGIQAMEEGLPLNKWIGVGNRALLDFDDFLQFLASDSTTKVIGIFMEGTEKARSFVELAGEVVKHKPVVILKAGRSPLALESTVTHTGTIAGSYDLYQDIFDQFRLINVESVAGLVSACKALSLAPIPKGDGIAVLTPSAGPSILLLDALAKLGCRLADFSSTTMDALSPFFKDAPVVIKNPLDAAAVGYAATSYVELADVVLRDPSVDLLIAVSIEHKNRSFPARELIKLKEKHGKPILVYFISEASRARDVRDQCQQSGLPLYLTAEDVAYGAFGLVRSWQNAREIELNHVD